MDLTKLPRQFTFRGFEYWKDGNVYKSRQLSNGHLSQYSEELLIALLNSYSDKRNIPELIFREELSDILSEDT